ncbi:MAG TPA: 4-hydroxy-tetrahydrodipicolinate reductase [Clostridia bacterium]
MSARTIRLFLAGCNGRMGRVIDRLASESQEFAIVGGSDVLLPDDRKYPVYPDTALCDTEYDVLIDFSRPSAFSSLLTLAERTGKPSVVCTTGLSPEQGAALRDLSVRHAVFQSANMSLGVNLLMNLVEKAAATLYPGFDIEIIEAHHNQKLDAPSGTAMMIADAIRSIRDGLAGDGQENKSVYTYDRHSIRAIRDPNEIGIHAIRGGSIVGEHEILFAGQDETLRISHSAASRDVFGRGALSAARYMDGKHSGFYSMKDLIG